MNDVTEQIANHSTEPVAVCIEPWGMSYVLQPGEVFRIVAVSEQQGQLEVSHSSSGIAVYGWPGCTIKVFRGEELVDDFSTTFPELPPGMSVKSFIKCLFDNPDSPRPA